MCALRATAGGKSGIKGDAAELFASPRSEPARTPLRLRYAVRLCPSLLRKFSFDDFFPGSATIVFIYFQSRRLAKAACPCGKLRAGRGAPKFFD